MPPSAPALLHRRNQGHPLRRGACSALGGTLLLAVSGCVAPTPVQPAQPTVVAGSVPAAQPLELRASVVSIRNSFVPSTGEPTKTVDFSFGGTAAHHAMAVAALRITDVVDDGDWHLRMGESPNNPLVPNRSNSMLPQATAVIRAPRIEARTWKYLEGEVDLFTPTPDRGTAVVAQFHDRPGVPLETADLRKYGIKVAYLDEAAYLELMKTWPHSPATRAHLEPQERAFLLTDPEKRVVKLEVVDRFGNAIHRRSAGSFRGERTLLTFPLDRAVRDTDLITINLLVPEAITTYKFRLEGIRLP